MSMKVLSAVSKCMNDLGLNYELKEWKDEPKYPYWVGEYQEIESYTEDGQQEFSFILTGFTRGEFIELEQQKEKIKKYLHPIYGKRATFEDGSIVAIFYAAALANIPTGDAELKKMQINLMIKEWRVI